MMNAIVSSTAAVLSALDLPFNLKAKASMAIVRKRDWMKMANANAMIATLAI